MPALCSSAAESTGVPGLANRVRANDVGSFGQNLRQAREARNITLQEITASTKIGTRSLQALEDERFDQLPGGIFNKGFVRAYARAVGLDEEKTLAAYMAAAKIAAPETDMQALSSQISTTGKGAPEPWSANAGAVVVVVAMIVALALGALWLKEQRKESKESAAAQQRTESPAVSATAPVSIPPQATASDPKATTGAEANAAGSATPNVTPNANQSANQSANQASGASLGAAATAPVEISVSATARAWISVSSDGTRVEQLVLDPDKPEMHSRTYKAQERLLLIVGNPSGVSVTYNGKPAGTLGVEGRRATITFTPQGMEKR